MFEVTLLDIERILNDFNINLKVSSFVELQRDNYEKCNSDIKQVRLIEKIIFEDNSAVVIRFKNETDVTLDLVEKQSKFAELFRKNGISCPVQYKTMNSFAKIYSINGYDVIVTVEDFVNGELKYVDKTIAKKTGILLAQTHNISEKNNFHVKCNVLFDPFTENELFSVKEFCAVSKFLKGNDLSLYHKIIEMYNEHMEVLSPFRLEPRYAVQGDISLCNLYKEENGNVGMFDFNRCGDNNLYCDAVMQAIFESRLMDYPKGYEGKSESIILPAFLKGYVSKRPFNDIQRNAFPYLYAVINAFWSSDIIWDNNSLLKECERKNFVKVHKRLEKIWRCLLAPSHDILKY